MQEAIEFFITAKKFSIENAQDGIRKMLPLIFSKESSLKEAVISAYKQLYLLPGHSKEESYRVAKNLTRHLFTNAHIHQLLTPCVV
jgi:hypothetical protein